MLPFNVQHQRELRSSRVIPRGWLSTGFSPFFFFIIWATTPIFLFSPFAHTDTVTYCSLYKRSDTKNTQLFQTLWSKKVAVSLRGFQLFLWLGFTLHTFPPFLLLTFKPWLASSDLPSRSLSTEWNVTSQIRFNPIRKIIQVKCQRSFQEKKQLIPLIPRTGLVLVNCVHWRTNESLLLLTTLFPRCQTEGRASSCKLGAIAMCATLTHQEQQTEGPFFLSFLLLIIEICLLGCHLAYNKLNGHWALECVWSDAPSVWHKLKVGRDDSYQNSRGWVRE